MTKGITNDIFEKNTLETEAVYLKKLYIALGFLFLIIGLIGLLLPVMPTIPFLIISSAYFSKGSDRFRVWLAEKQFYKYIKKFAKAD